jgi:hypothetical protein
MIDPVDVKRQLGQTRSYSSWTIGRGEIQVFFITLGFAAG